MASRIRHLNQAVLQQWEAKISATRIGQLMLRAINALTRGVLYSSPSPANATILEGLEASPGAGLSVDLTRTAVAVQRSGDDDVELVIDDNDGANPFNVALAAADPGNPRIDIIEGRVSTREAFADDAKKRLDPTTNTITVDSVNRDIEVYLELRAVTGTPAGSPVPPAAGGTPTAGSFIGSAAISDPIDLSSRYIFNFSVGRDGEFVPVDCRGATPSATTHAEIITAISNAITTNSFPATFTMPGGVPTLVTTGTGEDAVIKVKEPTAFFAEDAIGVLFGTQTGVSAGGLPIYGYNAEYAGDGGWFKLAEVTVPAAAVSLNPSDVIARSAKATWAADSDNIVNGFTLEGHRDSSPMDHAAQSVMSYHLHPSISLGGGGGFSPLIDWMKDSPYKLISTLDFASNGTTANPLIDGGNTTATDNTSNFGFTAAQQKVTTINLRETNFLADAKLLDRVHALMRWSPGTGLQDEISRVRVSRNGGLSWADAMEVRQASLVESNSIETLTSYDASNRNSFVALNQTSQIQLAQGFQVSDKSVIYGCRLQLIRVGTLSGGRFRAVLRGDSSGSPSQADLIAYSDWIRAEEIGSASFEFYQFDFIQQAVAEAASDYYVGIEVEDADGYNVAGADEIQWGADTSAPTYPDGQSYTGNGTTFTGVAGTDHIFEVLGKRVSVSGVADISQGEAFLAGATHYNRNSLLIDYDESNGDTDLELDSTGQQLLAQRVRLDAEDYYVTQFRLRMTRTGAPGGQLRMEIWSDDGTPLPGALLASSDTFVNADDVDTSEEYRTFKFHNGYRLEANTSYWFVLRPDGNYAYSGANKIDVRADASAPTYLSGTGEMASFNGTIWAAIATTTAIFKVDGAYEDEGLLSTYDRVNEETNQIDIDDGTTRERLAQAFTPDADQVFTHCSLLLQRVGTPGGSCYVELYENSGGEPGTLLATSDQVAISDILDTGPDDVRFDFLSPLFIDKSTQYWLVLRVTSAYTYVDTVDELQWFRDPSSPVHPGGSSSQYAGATWTPFAGSVHVYKVFGIESHLLMEVTGRKTGTQLIDMGLGYVFADAEIADDPTTTRVNLTAQMLADGIVPYGGMRVSPGSGLMAIAGTHTLVGGHDFTVGENSAYFSPADLSSATDITFIKLSISVLFNQPTLTQHDRLRNLPEPVVSRFNASTLELSSTGGANAFRVEFPNGIIQSGLSGARVSFVTSSNRYGGLGLDSGSESSDTQYYLYSVPGPGDQANFVFSATSPESGGPTGYRYWVALGAFVNDSSSDIRLLYMDSKGVVTGHEIDLGTSSNRGSTNTEVRRWDNQLIFHPGNAMTLTQSATLGDSITINESGIYALHLGSRLNVGSGLNTMQIARNSINAISAELIDALVTNQDNSASTNFFSTGRTLRLEAGEILRVLSSLSDASQGHRWTILKVG